MSVTTERATTSSDAVKQTLGWIRKQGFKPVPLRFASKAAFDEKYVDLNYRPPDDGLWQSKNLGVGVVCGPRHSGPVDVDLDCAEAVFFADKFLPPTSAIFGRKSKPRSHYLYKVNVEELGKVALIDPVEKATIIELRSDGGHQTVFPGSVHEGTGEIIEWHSHAFPEVPAVDAQILDFAVKKVAIATLVVRHMWSDGQRNEICKHVAGLLFYLEWGEEEAVSLIQAVMEYTGDDDKTRVKTVRSTYKKGEKGGKITGSNTLRVLLGDAKVVDKILEWAGSSQAALLQDYNERFAVVAVKGKFRVAETSGINRGEPPTLYAKEDFINLMETDTVVNDDGKRVPKARIWLANPRRRAYKAMDFVPGVEDASPILNLWTGWALEPKSEHSCAAWLDLLYYTICGSDDALYKWMLNWFANIIREPQNKPLTAPVLIGRQGAGKSLLIGYFGKILGPAYTTVTNEDHIYGKFNKHLATTLLLHSEEALYGGDRKHRGIIKSLITDEYRIFEQKGVDAERVHNYLRLVLTSNEAWAAPTEIDDRRFTIVDMEGRSVPSDTLKGVLQEMKEEGPSGLMHYLLNEVEYDETLPRRNVKNDALSNLKKINMDPIASWWYECLKMGQMLPDYLGWASKPEGDEWPEVVGSEALYVAMQLSLRHSRMRYVPDRTGFSLQLNKMTAAKLERIQKHFPNPTSPDHPREVRMMSRKQYSIVNMPTLENCRRAFNWYIGQDQTWPDNVPKEKREKHDTF